MWRETWNDLLRRGISASFRLLALLLEVSWRRRQRHFPSAQERLRRRFGVTATTPIRSYDAETEARIRARAAELGDRARWVTTSGSMRSPKTLLYTPRRALMAKLVFVDALTRVFAQLRIRRMSLFIMAPLSDDTSLTGMLLEETRLPGRLACLQAPYRVQGHASVRALAAEHGDTAVRCVLLALTNPGVLYATNPSTLATFFDRAESEWERCRALARRLTETEASLDATLRTLRRRLCARGAARRLAEIAASHLPLPCERWCPGLEAVVCWDGGYVAPFVERVRRRLPSHVRVIPMYSMATEAIETVTGARRDDLCFLPLAPGVLYEFLPEDAADAPEHLLSATHLQVGACYTLVVSDAYGLLRYQTDDVFRCARHVGRLPDLRFVRRRTLSYSFTGEKLTGAQLLAAYERLRERHAGLRDAHLTCVPTFPEEDRVPRYELLVITTDAGAEPPSHLAHELQRELCAMNAELAAKLASGRLAPFTARGVDVHDFVASLGGPSSWEAQFKFLPLTIGPLRVTREARGA